MNSSYSDIFSGIYSSFADFTVTYQQSRYICENFNDFVEEASFYQYDPNTNDVSDIKNSTSHTISTYGFEERLERNLKMKFYKKNISNCISFLSDSQDQINKKKKSNMCDNKKIDDIFYRFLKIKNCVNKFERIYKKYHDQKLRSEKIPSDVIVLYNNIMKSLKRIILHVFFFIFRLKFDAYNRDRCERDCIISLDRICKALNRLFLETKQLLIVFNTEDEEKNTYNLNNVYSKKLLCEKILNSRNSVSSYQQKPIFGEISSERILKFTIDRPIFAMLKNRYGTLKPSFKNTNVNKSCVFDLLCNLKCIDKLNESAYKNMHINKSSLRGINLENNIKYDGDENYETENEKNIVKNITPEKQKNILRNYLKYKEYICLDNKTKKLKYSGHNKTISPLTSNMTLKIKCYPFLKFLQNSISDSFINIFRRSDYLEKTKFKNDANLSNSKFTFGNILSPNNELKSKLMNISNNQNEFVSSKLSKSHSESIKNDGFSFKNV
ncbi:hypothetical protein EDEG_00569 [Edhazardia aedis USNM 41457]|uniref:Uncharacterized protein n=1 Tax=Edhazardia aedis (strain USNM 41457) TaxID=1003232 RepID=J9D0U3_EDHAE|nr:hypothetical protein EDEG_00569 [Edhazardia aedis USNM 41457]|eukprot:EJW01194.1 hypothetical protein EDEG_00569 [Edhazardia aedis USNM 41457]